MTEKSLEQQIEEYIKQQVKESGHDDLLREPLLGFSQAADPMYDQLKEMVGPWHKHPNELLPSANTVISFFVPFTKQVAEEGKKENPVSKLWGEAYLTLNELFDKISEGLADLLEKEGYESYGVAATHTYDPKKLQSLWSHRSAAVIAGLGSFGANRMVLTEKGSAGRFCTVLTSAKMTPTKQKEENPCLYFKKGSCKLCIKACPVGALKLEDFAPFVCHDRLLANAEYINGRDLCDVCGKCVVSCPLCYRP